MARPGHLTLRALACSMTAKISDSGHLESPPSFTGLGTVPSATRRQNVGTLIWRTLELSRTVKSGSVILIGSPHIKLT